MKWWGPLLLTAMGTFFIYNMITAYTGAAAPPLEKTGKHIRRGSHHSGTRYRGFFFGGGHRSGK